MRILYSDNVPELPEVETIARGLDQRVAGDTIESVWIGSKKQPLKSPAALIATTLEGKRIASVHRAGKHIVFDLEGAPKKKRKCADARTAQWIVHLGMTGRMLVSEPAADIAKHTHLIAKLASGRELRFIDSRMFGKLSVHLHAGGFDPGGVEPLEVSEDQFVALFRGRKTPIKSALLNQKLLRGVGNIYADESLFRAASGPAGGRRRSQSRSWASFTERSSKSCARRSPSADPRSPITSMPTAKKDSSNYSIECMAVRASPAWCAGARSGALCSPAAAVTIVQNVKNSPNRTI